jgi:cell division inhibitor SepF
VSLWHRLKVRLGLEDDWDDEYDDEYYDEEFPDGTESSGDRFYGRNAYDSPSGSNSGVKRAERESDYDRSRNSHLRSVPSSNDVAQMAPQVKMHIVEPKSYTEAQNIADKFKMGTPVIMNMSMTQADLAKRMIDFASGLTYGLDGGLQKISDKVFMLTPANVDVSAGDVRRLKDNGLFGIDG